jgi:hypothetical protein
MEYERIRNGDILLELRDGVPFQGSLPTRRSTRITGSKTWGLFLQDRWMIGPRDVQLGVRMDGVRLPAGAVEPGRHLRR